MRPSASRVRYAAARGVSPRAAMSPRASSRAASSTGATLGPLLREPVVEADRAEPGTGVGHERAFAQEPAEVPGLRVGDHLARIVERPQAPSDELVETEHFGT